MKQRVIALLAMSAALAAAQFTNLQLTGNGYYNGEPSITVNAATVGIVYESFEFGNDEIMLLASADNGNTFTAPVRITSNDSASWRPKVAVNDGYDIVWEDRRTGKREVFYSRCENGIPGPALKVSDGNVYSAFPALAANGNDLFITWEDARDGNDEIYFRKKVSGAWSAEKRLTANDSTSWGADIAFDASTQKLHVVFFDYRTGNDEVYYLSSADLGETWSAPVNLSNDAANSWEPRVAVFGGKTAVVWYSWDNSTTSYEVYFSENTDGTGFSAPQRISNPGADSKCPSIAMDAGATIATWEDYQDGNDEIYAVRKPHSESIWYQRRVTADNSDSFGADVALTGSDLLLTWFDYRTAVDQIWFAKGAATDVDPVEQLTLPSSKCLRLSASPNPFTGSVRLTVSLPAEIYKDGTRLNVWNAAGRLVYSTPLSASTASQTIDWTAAGLSNGFYFVKALVGREQASSRIILIR
ncbi:MAG: T9SS type A sorting domain-containing protein [Fibrobacterota bacterium]